MPPPHFSSVASNAAGSSSSAAAVASSSIPSINDLPKQQRQLVRDTLQHIRASLVVSQDVPASATKRSTTAAYDSIRKLIADPLLQPSDDRSKSKPLASSNGARTDTDSAAQAMSSSSSSDTRSLRKQVGTIVGNTLSRYFSDEMDQDSKPLTQLLISYIYALHTILHPTCIVLEWWDVLLRPALKNPRCNPSIAKKAHLLVVWAMASTKASAYEDEPAPSAIWPAPAQSTHVSSQDSALSSRRQGDAPYPISSTRAVSQSRSSESGDARRSELFATALPKASSADSLRRFAQRIFDLYTSEASSAGSREVEDEDLKEAIIDEPSSEQINEAPHADSSPSHAQDSSMDAEIGPTWKGNLEAIILTFGEEKPKAFFHHLSESFLDPAARIPILLLLTIFFRISSLHAYHVTATPFVRFLIMSLQLDTSKTSAALGSFALATLIPHIPNWIANGGAGGLPALLSILARIVDWRKLGPQWEERSEALLGPNGEEVEEWAQVQRISRRLQVRSEIAWRRLDTHFDTVSPPPPDAEKLFTFLYGIFPCNVIRFLRAPVDYLRKAEYESPFEVDWDDIIDETAVQNKAAPILRRHILHPSLVDMNAESEISDKQRWREHDAADITAECVCLYVGEQVQEPSIWVDSRRPSLIDRLPAMLSFQHSIATSAGSSTGTTAPSGLVMQRDDSTQSGDMTPLRYSRRRSLSDNFDRRGSSDSAGNPLDPVASNGRKRDLSVQPGQHAGTPMHSAVMPFLPQSTLLGNETDVFLQNHVRLRHGLRASAVSAARGERSASGPRGEVLSRSSSMASSVKLFSPARTNMTSALMSPSFSQQEDRQGKGATEASPALKSDIATPAFSPHTGSRSVSATHSANDLLGSPALDFDISQQAKSRIKEEVKQTIAYLKQENLQLRNELNYEIGQKDQMLRHIGRIHRDRIKDTVLEDERQNLYQTVRTLRAQLKSLRTTQERAKVEAQSSKSRHASWENELNAKLKTFREEKKVWTNEVRHLQIVKEDNEALIAKLEGQLHENANEVFELREQCKQDAQKVQAIRGYEKKIQRMEDCLRMWDDDVQKFNKQRRELRKMERRYVEHQLMLDAIEAEKGVAERKAALAQANIDALNRQVQGLLEKVDRQKHIQTVSHANVDGSASNSKANGQSESLTDEKIRMRTRIEKLEAELLDVKARQEEWQMSELMRRLQEQRDQGLGEAKEANLDVEPLHLLEPGINGSDAENGAS